LNWKPAGTPKAEPSKAASSAWRSSTRRAMATTSGKCCKGRAPTRCCGTTCPTARSPNAPLRPLADANAASRDPLFYSVIDRASGQVQGILSLMSIVPEQAASRSAISLSAPPCSARPRAPRRCTCWQVGLRAGQPPAGVEVQQRQRPLQARGGAVRLCV
jgi:hypothetical protein